MGILNMSRAIGILGVALITLGAPVWAERPQDAGVEIEPSPESEKIFSNQGIYEKEIRRDYLVRSLGTIRVSNLRGPIRVHGWPHHKIRVIARISAEAQGMFDAERMFSQVEPLYQKRNNGDIELRVQYGKGLDIKQRLRERKSPGASVDLLIYAPAEMNLVILGVDDPLEVDQWAANLSVRSTQGAISVHEVRSGEVDLTCPECKMNVSRVNGNLRIYGGQGEISVEKVSASQIYVENVSNSISAHEVQGKQTYVSKTGDVLGEKLKGYIEFELGEGATILQSVQGFVSGRTLSGDIRIEVDQWSFADKALIESENGNIRVELPRNFSAEVDIGSVYGKASLEFPIRESGGGTEIGPFPANVFRGLVGVGGEQLRVFSSHGDVAVSRKKPLASSHSSL